jgi:ATP-dependent Clp protease ATP-binding subunit ClpA
MFGNLFGPNKPKGQDPGTPPLSQPSDTQVLPGQYNPGGGSVSPQQQLPEAPEQSAVPPEQPGAQPQGGQNAAAANLGSRMDPAFRQNLSALSHLDQRTTQVLLHAQEETKRIHQQMIEPDQVLIGLLYDEGIFKLLEDFAIDVAGLLREIQSKETPGQFTAQPMLSNDSQQIFEKAFLEAKKRDAAFVTPEDVLMTILASNNKATAYLSAKGLKKEKLEEKLTKSTEYNYGKKSVLDKFGLDLTEEARAGKLDPIAGRQKEIERMIHIMLRRTKNNPVIIGEAGVGKTAIVEGLAEAIVAGQVPEALKKKRIIQLDMASLVAGASHRGEFEERLKGVINEAMASSGQLVLFIDEVHTVMGAGDEGAMDASNIIKPHLARGKLQIIGATTTAEYRKNFEKDKAFERRFQPIMVEEPSEEAAIKMLEVLRPKFEKFHNVRITDEALESAVKLSKKYIGERYLPDKAVDLLDEASAEVKLAHSEGSGMTYTTQNKQDVADAKIAKTKDIGNKADMLDDQGKVIEDAPLNTAKSTDAAKTSAAGKPEDPAKSDTTLNPAKPADPAQQGAGTTGLQQSQVGVPGQQQAANQSSQNPFGANSKEPAPVNDPNNPFASTGSAQGGSTNMQPGQQPGQPYQAYQVPGMQSGSAGQTPGQPVPQNSQPGTPSGSMNADVTAPGVQGADGKLQDPNAKPDENSQHLQSDHNAAQPGANLWNPMDPNGAVKPGETPEEKEKATHADVKGAPEVTKTDIENVVSNWTGIPITKLTEDEGEKLLKLEDRIHQRLIDQAEAVKAVSEAVRRGRIGLASGNRPIASFIFLGPTGTGKTELAKTLAEILFGKDDAMVRLDMSEYMEKHEVAKLIGAPPGYVGYEEGGQLTEAVRAKPYSIVLLDEVEKAHPDVFNILLQLLEDGRVTDNKGNTISFKNTIIICTSNIGSAMITQMLSEKDNKVHKTEEMEAKEFKELSEHVTEELRKFFRPELLNRFDDIVIFKPLRREDMGKIAKLGIDKTAKLLKEQKFALQITKKAIDQLALEGYDPVYGARPLRRLIQTSIENPIALAIISRQFVPGDTIVIDYDAANSVYVFRQGEKKVTDKKKDTSEGSEQDKTVSSEAGAKPGVSAPENPSEPGQENQHGQPAGDYPDWVKQAMNQNTQQGINPQNVGEPAQGGSTQPGGTGAANQMPGSTAQPAEAPQPTLVDQMTQPAVEAPFDPMALMGNAPPAEQPTNGMPATSPDGTQMQKVD